MYPPKTRLLMMPDSWFTPFHKVFFSWLTTSQVTGTSGPYLFYGGLFAFLVNKELWVYEEQGHMTVGWILFYLILSRTIGCELLPSARKLQSALTSGSTASTKTAWASSRASSPRTSRTLWNSGKPRQPRRSP